LGLAIVGSGRIGSLRARLAAGHPAVRFIAVSDQDPARASALAQTVGAQVHSGSNDEVIRRPEVNAVVVSTSEGEHLAPVLAAIELGKAVLVEKPIALTLAEADEVLQAIERKEQLTAGRLGTPIGGAARVFNSRSQALAMLRRNPHATPVVDALTYYVDLMNWFLEGRRIAAARWAS
jgi:predicted dehydrogenase